MVGISSEYVSRHSKAFPARGGVEGLAEGETRRSQRPRGASGHDRADHPDDAEQAATGWANTLDDSIAGAKVFLDQLDDL